MFRSAPRQPHLLSVQEDVNSTFTRTRCGGRPVEAAISLRACSMIAATVLEGLGATSESAPILRYPSVTPSTFATVANSGSRGVVPVFSQFHTHVGVTPVSRANWD